jgi:hypothetical protein
MNANWVADLYFASVNAVMWVLIAWLLTVLLTTFIVMKIVLNHPATHFQADPTPPNPAGQERRLFRKVRRYIPLQRLHATVTQRRYDGADLRMPLLPGSVGSGQAPRHRQAAPKRRQATGSGAVTTQRGASGRESMFPAPQSSSWLGSRKMGGHGAEIRTRGTDRGRPDHQDDRVSPQWNARRLPGAGCPRVPIDYDKSPG